MTKDTTPPASPSPNTHAVAPPSPCSIWTPIEDELEALSMGWDSAAFKEKLQRTRAATPPVLSAMRFPSLTSPNSALQRTLPMTDPRPSRLSSEREASRRRLFPDGAKPAPLNAAELEANGLTMRSSPESDPNSLDSINGPSSLLSSLNGLDGVDFDDPLSSSDYVPPLDVMDLVSMGNPAPQTGPLMGAAPGALCPSALPPNTLLVPADDPNNPGQPLFRLMTVDPAIAGINGVSQPNAFSMENMHPMAMPNMMARNAMGGMLAGGMEPLYMGPHASLPAPFMMSPKINCLVEFKRGRTVQYESPVYVAPGEYVIVGGDRGEDLGMVVHTWVAPSQGGEVGTSPTMGGGISPNSSNSNGDRQMQYDNYGNAVAGHEQPLGRVIRRATPKEVQHLHSVQTELEKRCADFCQQKVLEHGLVLVIVDAEYQFDRKKLTFYYDAAERQDFRDLVRDLYKTYRARIWMSKINSGHR